ncbi:MAG: baseplate J/gp47 family protein [Thermodesulfobacteriota bacterium]
MPLPLPELDDRRFDDLVTELRERLSRHLPELTVLAPGDPVFALVDLFAWLTETVIFRANLIPERQRRAFLNLLQIPLRPAVPARGLVAIDAPPTQASLPPLLAAESGLRAKGVAFATSGEVQPTPLALHVLVKEEQDDAALAALGITRAALREQYGMAAVPFRPRTLIPGRDALTLAGSLDHALHLGLAIHRRLVPEREGLRQALRGRILNIGLAPAGEGPAPDLAMVAGIDVLRPRPLIWELAWQDKQGVIRYLPLEEVADSSLGGRRLGVARLRLPANPDLLAAPVQDDPQFAGMGDAPPEPPAELAAEQFLFWLRLRCPDEPNLALGYLGVNCVEVLGQGIERDAMVGVGTGRPDQVVSLPWQDIDPESLVLEVAEGAAWVPWQRQEVLAGGDANARVYRLDPAAGLVVFGDGQHGRRPPAGSRIRVAYLRHGGGLAGNLPAGAIRELAAGSGSLVLRHEWPTRGGRDAESIDQAERRIPAFLAHRERAVAAGDFAALARDNPINPVARAEVLPGFFPGTSIATVRPRVPGVVSVFVLPPAAPALAAPPRPSAGLLQDVFGYLASRKVLGTELYVLSPEFVPMAAAVAMRVRDPQVETETRTAVAAALRDYLWALPPAGPLGQGWPLGAEVDAAELRTQASRVPGVLAVTDLRLFAQEPRTGTWQEQPGRLPLADYQLPSLAAVETAIGDGPAGIPAVTGLAGVGAAGAGTGGGGQPVPVPVNPEVC